MSENTGAPAAASADANSPVTPDSSQGQNQQVKSDAAPATPKTWKSKVDGKEVTWDNEDQLVRDAGLGKAAFERMRQASEATKAAKSFIDNFKKDPMAALEDESLGLNDEQRREIIEKYYQKKYLETDNLSPHQKEIQKLQAELKRRDDAQKAVEEESKTKEQQKVEAQWRETYQQQIIEAIDKGGLPKTPRVAARVAFFMAQAAEAGFDAPVETIIAQVGKDLEGDLQVTLADNVPMAHILKVLPPNFVKRLRQHDIEQYKARQNKPAEPVVSDRAPRAKKEERMPYSQVLKKLGA